MKVYLTNFSFYEPSPENPGEMPKLEYTDALFRRRLSQITRMTIEVVHNLIESNQNFRKLKLVFTSFRGEIARQLKINKGLVEDSDVMPAPFSLSVFNTPPAAATIALGMKAGYTAIYPGENNFYSGFLSACASVLSGSEKELIFSYADEKIPEEYAECNNYTKEAPLAFAAVISSEKTENAVEIDLTDKSIKNITPKDFLLILKNSKKL